MQHAQITIEYFKGEKHYVRTQMKEKESTEMLVLAYSLVWIEFQN